MCYFCDIGSKAIQRSFNQFFSQGMLIFGIEPGIAHRMWDSNSGNYPVGSNRLGNCGNCSHMNNGDTVSFDFFDHRCTATSTGPSCGGEDNPIDPRLF